MSNVLIGIIGVILFIGLALAGAVILGTDFTTASSSSKAAAVVAQLQQLSAAINMSELKTGQTFTCQDPANLVPRFLNSVPVSPMPNAKTDTTYAPRPQPNNDMIVDSTNTAAIGLAATYVTTNMGTDATAAATCQSIADTLSGGVMTPSAQYPTGFGGCMQYGGTGGPYVAWLKR